MAHGIDRFIAGLPKVELHVHLEGSLRPATRARLAQRHGVALPDRPDGVPFRDFSGFVEAFVEGLGLLRDDEDLVVTIDALAADLARNQVRYAEVTTTMWAHVHDGSMAAEAYRDALAEGRTRAWRDHGVELAWVIDIPRGFEPPGAGLTADFLCSPLCPEGTVAIGLGGAEIGYPAGDYATSFERAAAVGLHRVPHGGETGGARYVLDCLDLLGAERIGHGVMAVEDPAVVRAIVERDVPLEICLTSNILLGAFASYEEHPLRYLRQSGVRVTLATDDPGYFANDLCQELRLAHRYHGVSAEDLRQLQLDGVAMSFQEAAAAARLRQEILDYQPNA